MSMDLIPAGESIFRLCIAMTVLTGLAIILRFFIRATSKASFAADDWWALASVAFYHANIGIQLWCKLETIVCIPC